MVKHTVPAALAAAALLAASFPAMGDTDALGRAQKQAMLSQPQPAIAQAAQWIARGDTALASRDYEAAMHAYKTAVDLLPETPATTELEDRAIRGYAEASKIYLRQMLAELDRRAVTRKSAIAKQRPKPEQPAIPTTGMRADPSKISPAGYPLAEGDREFGEKHYDTATAEYQRALDSLPDASDSPAASSLRKRTLAAFCEAGVRLAEQRVAEGRYADARSALETVLAPKYDPHYRPALQLLSKLGDTGKSDPASAPVIFYRTRDVATLLKEAKAFYDTARWDLAYKRYDQVLDLDPTNAAARKGQEDIAAAKQKHASDAYPESNTPSSGPSWPGAAPRKYSEPPVAMDSTGPDANKAENIRNKLRRIIIPQIRFADASLRDAIEFLHRKSIDLDTTEPDPVLKGVNIVLENSPDSPAAAERKITLSLTNIPLDEALKYIAELGALKIEITPYAVKLTPLQQAPAIPAPNQPTDKN